MVKVDPLVKTIFCLRFANVRRVWLCEWGGIGIEAALAIPALESALGAHPCGALSSVQLHSV
jgi:hypothetical protein